MNTKRQYMITVVVAVISIISIGYAILSTTLSIQGIVNLKNDNWNIHFANIKTTSGSLTPATAAHFTDKTSLDFSMKLKSKSDYYEFSFDVVNEGQLDAMISAINKTPVFTKEQSMLLEYSITYKGGAEINVNDALKSGKSYTIVVRVRYVPEADTSFLPSLETIVIDFHFDLSYQETNGNEVDVVLGKDANALVKQANNLSITSYTAGNTHEMYSFTHPATAQTEEESDYRYIGNDPYNYIEFNNETWRILGVFNGKMKLIRNEAIGSYSWDTSDHALNDGMGVNEWSQADAMKLLNEGPYYTRTTGICYTGMENATSPCDFSTTGLTPEAKNQISTEKYYLGAIPNTNNLAATDYYNYERSLTLPATTQHDTITRTTFWEGKVGLMYSSDYVYQFGYGVDNTCFNDMNNCSSSNSIWLNDSSLIQWSISPVQMNGYTSASSAETDIYKILSTYAAVGIKPVVYLNPDIMLSGDGSQTNMYKIVN